MEFFGEVGAWFSNPANLSGPDGLPARLGEHLILSVIPLLLAVAIALPLGAWIGHSGRAANLVINIANVGRAIPSLAILAVATMLLQAFLVDIGLRQVASEIATMIAMIALAIPPILTNAYVGINEVDDDLVEAGRGMGMRELQLLRRVEVPIALPVIMAGIRSSAVTIVATATLAALVGGGTLGDFILQGLYVNDQPRIFGAAVLVALLALATELAFGLLQRLSISPGLRPETGIVRRASAPVGTPS